MSHPTARLSAACRGAITPPSPVTRGRGEPRLLDLFHGEGIAADGYAQAGWDVTGVDVVAAKLARSPHRVICADALAVLEDARFLAQFDAIHASPPCQAHTLMSNRSRGQGGLADTRVDLLTPTLATLRQLTMPWVVENVVGAPMRVTLRLHGGMFGLGVHRPRIFESNQLILAPQARACVDAIGVYGRRPGGRRTLWRKPSGQVALRVPRDLAQGKAAMGVTRDVTWEGLKEAIPPAYTRHIGEALAHALR